jgi:hypothetical protein
VSVACPRPLADETLLDWWAGELSSADRRPVEEHLLACDACSTRGRVLAALAGGVRDLVVKGRVLTVVTPSVLERLRREGRTLREYRVHAGESVHCTVAPHDDVLLARLQLRVGPTTRIDLLSRIDDGEEHRVADLPIDPAAHEVLLVAPIEEIRARPAHVERVQLVAVEAGGERLLGEYTFDHTPWPGHRGA